MGAIVLPRPGVGASFGRPGRQSVPGVAADAARQSQAMRRFRLLYVVPTLVILAAVMWPLISGRGTLYLRDVLTSHYPLKASQAAALARGELPLVDVHRAGGQPLLGNPNVLPLYPDNLLYLVASPLWALNAHFWLHLLLAPLAFYWLARCWGLSRPAAWAAGVCYASSGFMLSLFNLYNLVAGAALAPAFVAACLDAWRGQRRLGWGVAALLWTLLLLAGDPLFALLALAAALSAGAVRERALPRQGGRALAAMACGSALAAPMIVEFLRILPLSLRGYRSYSPESALLQSWDPRSMLEWLLPLFFGPPDFSFWGQRYYDGLPPLFYSFYPGLLCLALIPLATRGRGAAWGWTLTGGGLFLALGKWNPLVRELYELPGASVLRYPVKVWLLVAMGAAMLCGLGFERLLNGDGRRLFGRLLLVLTAFFLGAWWLLLRTPAGERLRGLEPERLVGPLYDDQRLRWAGLCLLSLVVLALLAMALWLMRRHRTLGGALLLAVHMVGQVFFLEPLFDADEIEHYAEPPALLATIPPNARLVHGGLRDLFGVQRLSRRDSPFSDTSTHWLTRSHFAELYPFSGIPWGRRYELNPSPEGLDSFFTYALVQALPRMKDRERIRVLEASGVDVLLLDRELAGDVPDVRLVARAPTAVGEVFVYRLAATAPPVHLATRVHRAPHMNAALAALGDPAFDSRTMVVLPGEGAPTRAGGGRAEIVRETADVVEVDVEAGGDSVLVVQRTFHEIYRATVDGEPVDLEPANIHRLAVKVPAGEHRVRIWADRRPTRWTWGVALVGLLGLILLTSHRVKMAP